jgi:hypothetical protein
MGQVYYTKKNGIWQCDIMLEGGSANDQKECDDYKEWDLHCYWYRLNMANKCDCPEFKNKDFF